MSTSVGAGDVWLVYDGECPVCKTYCVHARVREAVGRLHLVDARQPGELMDEITAAGLDIDQGMVVKFEGILYYGPEAVRVLTLLSTPSGFFNRLSYWLFGSTGRARIFYPIGKAIRNLILKLLGIRYIENLSKSKQEWRA
jgi:predicted DCC family thiol-disulfide oxidoreductase YuxK